MRENQHPLGTAFTAASTAADVLDGVADRSSAID
jgi:hypothetical protein